MNNNLGLQSALQYIGNIVLRLKALKPAVWQWNTDTKKLAIIVPPPEEHPSLQRSETQYHVPMTEEEIIFMCHCRTDIEALLRINSMQAEVISKLRKQLKNKRKKKK